jgi:hypothetical protein
MENLNVKIETTGNDITIREGQALDLRHPEKIRLSGNINSISQFLAKRYNGRVGVGLQMIEKDKAVVIVDQAAMRIILQLDPENHFGLEVAALLEFTDEIKAFHINDNHLFTRETMIKLLKFNKRFFADPMKQETLLESYMKLNLTGSTQIKSESDDRGNKDVQFKKTIESQNIPSSFVLEMPIFKGQAVEKFRVDICLDVTEGSVRFWFESVELHELIELRKEQIFAVQLKNCQDFVIINK